MAVNYGVLRGAVTGSIPFKTTADHFQIEVMADQAYRIAVDVYSEIAGTKLSYSATGKLVLDTDRMVMFYKNENYTHPILAELLKLNIGFTPKANMPATICLDYLSFTPPLFDITLMKVVTPAAGSKPGENLNGDIAPWVTEATNNKDATIFAFGSGWNDNIAGSVKDERQYFASNPSVGVHDIHMNQGDTGSEAVNNGRNQDGALFIYFKSTNKWVAMFFRFQNQSIHTDNHGNPIK